MGCTMAVNTIKDDDNEKDYDGYDSEDDEKER